MKQNTIFSLREKIILSCTSLFFAAALLCCLYGRQTECVFFLLALALQNLLTLLCAGKNGTENNNTEPENGKPPLAAAIHAPETENREIRARLKELAEENKRCALALETEKKLRQSYILPDTGRNRLTLLDLAAFSREMLQELEALPAYSNVKGCVQCEREKLLLPADKTLLRLLYRSLLDNAYKNLAYSGRLLARLTLTLTETADGVLIIFRDNGPGVSPEELPHLFERNYQGANRISGSGLGLFQARWIVENMGGSLSFKSTPDSGFAAYLTLPVPSEGLPKENRNEG